MGLFLVRLLGADARVGLAMFSQLRSANAQNDAIKGAASVNFPPKYRDLMNVVFGLVAKGRGKRNDLAHNLFVRNPHIPSALIKIDPAKLLNVAADFQKFSERDEGSSELTSTDYNPNTLEVYFKDDFENILRLLMNCQGYLRNLSALVSLAPDEQDEVARSLCMMPGIRGSLDRLETSRRKQCEGADGTAKSVRNREGNRPP